MQIPRLNICTIDTVPRSVYFMNVNSCWSNTFVRGVYIPIHGYSAFTKYSYLTRKFVKIK